MASKESNFLKLAKARTTTYQFSERVPETDDLYQILEAGRWAPSAGNIQPWHFIVIMNKDVIHRILKECPYGEFHNDPPILVAVILCSKLWFNASHIVIKKLGRVSYPEAYLSMGMPVLNMSLAAQDLDMGSCILTPGKGAAKYLELEGEDRLVLLMGLGYEAEGAFRAKSERKELESLFSFETFNPSK